MRLRTRFWARDSVAYPAYCRSLQAGCRDATSRQPKGRWGETGWNQRIGGRNPVRASSGRKRRRDGSVFLRALSLETQRGPRIFAAALLIRELPVTVYCLRFQGDGSLRDLIESSNDTSVGFVATLRNDERSELARNVNVGLFECAAGDAAQSAGSRPTDGGLTRGQGRSEVVITRVG